MTPPDDVSERTSAAVEAVREEFGCWCSGEPHDYDCPMAMAEHLADLSDEPGEGIDYKVLHREAKEDVSRLMAQVEELEEVRVTCAGGHTSTLSYLRESADCSAPCCPECGECSFTFEPSEALDD